MLKLTINYKIIFIIIQLFFLIGCCAKSPEIFSSGDGEKLAAEKFGKDYSAIKNSTGNYVLYFKDEVNKNDPHFQLFYFVFDLKKESIVLTDTLQDAKIKWLDDDHLEIRISPEIISDETEAKYYKLNVQKNVKQ
ncbi:MAG: hypothetical protein HXY50_04500 [Ignavibacteriaceae bacterium]|nr:hypothetical protein [Ignavibacteriaceae bacterium]